MDQKLFELVKKHLIANIEPHETLHEVIIGGLPEELTDEQIAECNQILGAMLTALQAIVKDQRAIGGQSNN